MIDFVTEYELTTNFICFLVIVLAIFIKNDKIACLIAMPAGTVLLFSVIVNGLFKGF